MFPFAEDDDVGLTGIGLNAISLEIIGCEEVEGSKCPSLRDTSEKV